MTRRTSTSGGEMPTSADEVCGKYADRGVKIRVTELQDGYVYVEADEEGLTFLAELFWAQAHDPHEKNHLGPRGAGNALFTKGSTVGFCIRRIDPSERIA